MNAEAPRGPPQPRGAIACGMGRSRDARRLLSCCLPLLALILSSALDPPMNSGDPTRFPWTKKCVEGESRAYVDGTNGNDIATWGRSEAQPHKTIQYAVDMFKGSCTTIYIKEGTYFNQGYVGDPSANKDNTNKVVNLNNVTNLIIRNFGGEQGTGAGGDRVVLRFDGSGGFIGGSAANGLSVRHVEIYGLEIAGENQNISYADAMADRMSGSKYYSGRGVAIWKGDHIHLHHLKVHDTPAGGLRVDNGDYVVIEDNEVYRCTWWSRSAESAVVIAQSISVDDKEGIKMIMRNNLVHENMNKIPYYNPNYAWDYSPISSGVDCSSAAGCYQENTNGCDASGCVCPYQCRYGKRSQDYIIDGMGVYVTRNSDTYAHGQMELSGNRAYKNGINGLVFHRTFRGVVKKNVLWDNGQVPKDGHDQDVKQSTDWMRDLKRTRQPYSGLVLNNADGVKVWSNTVRARYSDDYAFTIENDAGTSYAPGGGGNNKNCRGRISTDFEPYVATGSPTLCDTAFGDTPGPSPSSAPSVSPSMAPSPLPTESPTRFPTPSSNSTRTVQEGESGVASVFVMGAAAVIGIALVVAGWLVCRCCRRKSQQFNRIPSPIQMGDTRVDITDVRGDIRVESGDVIDLQLDSVSLQDLPLAPGWSMHKTENGATYYFNTETGESTWNRPCASEDI